MAIPFQSRPRFTFTGIEFDLGGGEFLTVRPHLQDAGEASHTLSLPTEGNEIPAVDGADVFRWGDGSAKSILSVPVSVLAIGDVADVMANPAYISKSSITDARTYELPNKNGTFAMLDDTVGMDPQYISGFGHRTTPTSIIINAGRAYVQSVGRVVEYAGGTYTYPGTIPNNATVHVFLNSIGNISVSAANPAAPYFGTARSANGNPALRYLFSVRSQPSGNQLYIQRGIAQGNVMDVTFLHNTGISSMIQGAGSDTSPTHLTALPWAPENVTTDIVVRAYNNGSGAVRLFCYEGAGTSFVVFTNIPVASEMMRLVIPCDHLCRIQYDSPCGTGSLSLALFGYRIVR